MSGLDEEMILIANNNKKFSKHTWIADSGATTHMCNDLEGTTNPGGAIRSKLEDRGIKGMFLGYAANHAGNVYRVLNLETKKILITRDVKWLKSLHAEPTRYDVDRDDRK